MPDVTPCLHPGDVRRWVAIDQHKFSIVAAVLPPDGGKDRVKTYQRDAERLVRLLMIDGLHAVRVPTPEEEALRDLVRAREDLRGDLMRARGL
jgi:transposase